MPFLYKAFFFLIKLFFGLFFLCEIIFFLNQQNKLSIFIFWYNRGQKSTIHHLNSLFIFEKWYFDIHFLIQYIHIGILVIFSLLIFFLCFSPSLPLPLSPMYVSCKKMCVKISFIINDPFRLTFFKLMQNNLSKQIIFYV
jgi:hypothetical protein